MKLKSFFQYALTVALLALVGTTAFAQQAVTTVYDNGGKAIRGNYQLIGNRSDAGYDLNIPTIDGCPSTVKWARLYWGGHAGGTGDPNTVRITVPGGQNKTITSTQGHTESKTVVWENADYLIYRVYFTYADGDDMDMQATITSPGIPIQNRAGYCGNNMPRRSNINDADIKNQYALWSGDNTGNGLESILINVKKLRQEYPTSPININFKAAWYGSRTIRSGNMAIKAEAYRGEMMRDPADGFNWIPNTGAGATKVGEAIFPVVNTHQRACWDLLNFGDFQYDPADGRILWRKSGAPGVGSGNVYLGENTAVDPTKTIVNDGTRVDDDSYYYRWADVTADLQALATAGNLNGTYTVNNIYNNGGASWKFGSGWALVVVYENPKFPENRVVTIQNGFQRVGAGAATTSADNNVFASGYLKPPGTGEHFGQVTLGGEPNVAGDHFKVNATDIGYNGRAGNNFFNGTTTIHNEAPQVNHRGWDVSIFGSTIVPAGATNLNTVYEANNGGYDAYIKIVNAVSAATTQPSYQIETKVLNAANADIADQRIALNTEAKYQINLRNTGAGTPTTLKLEAHLPQNLIYDGIEGTLPAGVSAPAVTQVAGRTMLTFNMTPTALPANMTAANTITIKVKTTNDCNALRDACSNRLSIQPKLVYTVANPAENREQLSYKKLADCAPAPTTFYIDDTPCGASERNTLPYCAAFELDGGAGYTSYKWTKQGQGVVSTSQRYQVNAAGTYVLERTGGPADCANVSTKTYVIQPRSGNDALHPLRNNDKVVEKQTCNNTGLDYLQVALCGTYVDLTATGTGLPDGKVEWYKYEGSTTQLVSSCPPAPIGVEPGNWRKLGTGNTFRLQGSEVHNNGSHFAILLKHDNGCNLDYYFRAYKSTLSYNLTHENIMPLDCGSGAAARGWLKISNIPTNGDYQYKIAGPSNSVSWTDIPSRSFDYEVTAPGRYTVTLRPKLASGASQYQNNVCNFEQYTDVRATTNTDTNPNFTLSKVDVLCVGTDPATGVLNVQLSNQVTLPVYVTVTKQGGGQVVKYLANTEALRSSENLTGADLTKLRTLGKGTYEVTLQPQLRNTCTSPARTIEIKEVPQLKILSMTYKDPSCGPTKQISVTYQGGTPPYTIKILGSDNIDVSESNGNALAKTINFDDPRFTPAIGTKNYTIQVVDANSCTVTKTLTYKLQPQPTFTSVVTPADCAPNSGTIKFQSLNPAFDVTKYTVQYAIQKQVGGAYPTTDTWIKQTYPNGTFTGLTAGKYRLRVYYTRAGITCSYPAESYQVLNNRGQLEYLTGPDFDDQEVTITEGAGPLKAFAMVSHLACKPLEQNPTSHAHASIKISNLEGGNGTAGGVGPGGKYEVSLDGGITWNGDPLSITGVNFVNNEVRFDNVPVGTYTVKVRSKAPAGGVQPCETSFTIQVEAPLAKPTFNTNIVYDCEGAARVLFSGARDDYSYHVEKSSTLAGLPTEYTGNFEGIGAIKEQTFLKTDAGTTQYTRIFYKKKANPKKLLFREDFGEGDATDFAGLNRDSNTAISPNLTYGYPCSLGPNKYAILGYGSHHNIWWNASGPCHLDLGPSDTFWISDAPKDHTSGGTNDKGRYMYIDMGENVGLGETLYEKTVTIEPNAPIGFELYVLNLNRKTPRRSPHGDVAIKPDIRVRVVNPITNTVIGEVTSAEIDYNVNGSMDWVRISSENIGDINPGNINRVKIQIQNTRNFWYGNDFAIDDIEVWQGPVHCPTLHVDATFNLEAGKELKISALTETEETCNGLNDGRIDATVANYGTKYKWYVVTRGTNNIVKGSTTTENTTSLLTVTGIAPGLYTLVITDTRQAKYADNQACVVTKDFEIKRNPAMVVTPNRTEAYLNCGVDRQRLVIFGQNNSTLNGLFNITGGKQPNPSILKYTIKVKNLGNNNEEAVTPDSQGVYRYTFSAAKYKITIVDDNGCNDGASYIFEMKERNKLASIDVAYTTNCNPGTGIGDLEVSHTWVTTGNGGTLQYQYKKKTDAAWSADSPSNVILAATIATWEKGVPYLIKAHDEFSCGAEKEVIIYAPIENLLTADYTVVQPANACPPATPTPIPSSITVNRVRSGNPSPSYQYAFVPAGNTPNPTDYAASNTKSGLAAGRYDIYIKDANAVPETCGRKVVSSVEINNLVPTGMDLDGGGLPIRTEKSAYCDNIGGAVILQKFWGKGPFRIEVERTSSPVSTEIYNIPRTAVPGKVTIAPATPPNVGLMTVTNYAIENLSAGNYTLRVYDEGNADCQPMGTTVYSFTINSMTWAGTPSIAYSTPGCNATNMAFAVKITHDATPATDYEVVYRIVKRNGGRVVNGAWVREVDTAPTINGLTGNIGYAIFDNEPIDNTLEVEAALVRKKSGTNPTYVDTDVLCTTEITGISLVRPDDTANVHLNATQVGTCLSNYDVTVRFGAANATYTNVRFYLNNDGTGSPIKSWPTYTAGATPATTAPAHTISGLTRGRNNIIYIHYIDGSGTACKTRRTIIEPTTPVTIQADIAGNNVANTCSPSMVNFDILVTSGAPTQYKIYKRETSGSLTLLAGPTTIPAGSPSIPPAPTGMVYTLPLSTTITTPTKFVVGLIDGVGCEWMTHDITANPTPASALVKLDPASKFSVSANSEPISCATGKGKLIVTASATGGVGPFTFSFLKGTGAHENAFLRRNIQVRNVATSGTQVEFDFKDSDFIPGGDAWFASTFHTLTFRLRITDQATGCFIDLTASGNELDKFINSKHKAKYDIAINPTGTGAEACDNTQQNYMLKITLSDLNASGATVAQPTDYEYSIDGGVTYTTFSNTPGGVPGSYVVEVPVPVFFDHTKVKVRSKLSACESTLTTPSASLPGTNQRLTYPKLAFTATKTQDVACDSGGNYTAKFKAVITNGTGQEFLPSSILPPAVIGGGNRYDIKVTYRTTNTQENRQASPFTAPTGSAPIGSTPVDTNVPEQDISVAPTSAPGGTEFYYTVWIKDKGNKYCTDYIPSAPIKVLPAETPADLNARHKVEGADVEQQNACTGTTGTKGAFEFTRNTTPASPAIAREDVSFEYDLQKAPIGTTAFASTGTTITDANIIPNRSTDPLGTVRYRVEGLDEGDYRLIVKKSSNGECGGYDVTNISISGNVVRINKNPKVDFEMTTSSPPKPKMELVQMACAATTSPIFGLTPATDKAQLKFKVKGGVPPYTAEVYIKDVRTSEFLFSRAVIPSTVTALPYPTLTIHEAEYAFDLPDRGIKYEVTLKIRDAKGCELDAGSGYAFHDEVLPFHKIESVTTKRTQRMSCDAATGQEIVELTINYSDPNGNGDGYNVQVDKLSGGTYTPVGAYAVGERTVADIPGTGIGSIILPYVTDDVAEYRIILFNKKTKCTYQLPTHYRMVKSEKPRVNFILKEGGCGDQGTTPAPTTIDLTFELQVEGGDFETNGYNYVITNPLGYNSVSLFSKLAKETKTLQVPITQAPANAVTQFQVDLRVVDSKCDATATTQVTRPAQIHATSAITHAMTYCGGQANNDGVIAVTEPASGGWGGPYQYQIVSNGVEGGWTDELTFSGLGEGSHYVQVRDSKGCLRDLATFTFLQFNSATMGLTVPAATVPEVPSCQGAQDGTIKLAGVTGGTGGTPIEGKLSYELFDAETELSLGRILPDDDTTTPVRGTVTFDNVGAGTYFIRVYSDMLCADDHKDTPPIKVGDPGSIIARAYLSKYPGCNQEGSVTVEIDKRPEMRPSRKDYKVELYDVTDEANPQRVGGTPILKSGTDGITGVTYEFATGVKHGHNGGDVERKYQVKVWDNNGSATPPPAPCEGLSNKVYVDKISELDGEVVAEESELNLKCFGSSYGKITVTATGGKADEGYNFKLLKGGSPVPTGAGGTSSANPNTQGVFEGLAKGDYQVEITQTNGGCNARVIPVTITEETKYVVKYKLEDVKCNGDKNGKITITHTEGFQHNNGVNRKLTYAISPRLDRFLDKPNGVIDSLAPGKYFVIVQDENGCRPNEIYLEDQNGTLSRINEDIIEFTIGEPEPLSVSVNPEYTEHESCVDAKDGKTRLRVFGGTPFVRTSNDNEYELVIDGKAPIRYHTRDNGDLIGNLTAGEHTFRIIDKNGCEAETAVTIDPGSEVKLKLSAGKYECVDGKIKWVVEASVTPTTAALNVRYLLTEVGNPAKVDQPHDNTQFNLDVDLQSNTTKTYIISVLHKVAGHGECRVDSDPIQVAAKEPLTIDPLSGKPTVSCHGGEDGRFEITAHGGSGKYNYGLKKADGTFDWQGDNNKFTGLKVGSYTVGVKDTEYNCIAELTNIVVESPDKIAIKQQSIQHVGCKGETNGKISYAIEGGNTPYKWEVYKEDGTTTSKRGTGVRVAVPFEITDLAAGKYMIKVTDAKDCDASKEFEIIEGVDLGGRIVQSYDCHASIDENNKVLVVAGGRGANSDTAAEATYDVYVSVNTPYLVVNPSVRGAANRLRYAIGVEGGTTPIQRYEFEGTTPEGSDNTHNMYQIKHASLIPKLNAARALQEGLNQYKIYLYYFDKDNPAMSDAPLCESVRDLNIEYYPPVKITNTSISNDLNLLKVKVEGGKERYTVYFCSAQYHTAEEAKSHYVQKVEDVKAGDEVTYFVQKTDYEEENPDTGKVEKKIRVYVEDSKGELKEENGGKEACGHSVFLYKEFVDVVIPNFFTPNGDGQYDTWAPLNLASYPNAETVIYDRYGRKIATLNNKEEWDGTYGGEALPTGDYWFILRLNEPDDNRTFKGHFTLYR